jgi:hypothetical protein
VCRLGAGHTALNREIIVKTKELRQALRFITKVAEDPRLKPGQRDELRLAKREFEKFMQSGKWKEARLFRAVEIVSKICLEVLQG